ncbi:hypothetical protein [Sporosarcina sp. FSL K6-3457]
MDKIDSFVKEMLEVGNVKVMADVAKTTMDLAELFTPIGSFLDKF